jgi:hypothetical protein
VTTRPTASTSQDIVAVPLVVDSPKKGEVRLRFPGGASVPGVQFFFVVRDDNVAAQQLDPSEEDWGAADLDPGTAHCWRVFAVVEREGTASKAAEQKVEPVCRRADGRTE